MTKYKNLSGKSGVNSYETGDDYIAIQFVGGGTYLYTYDKPGATSVEKMKTLALKGKGLSTYISRNVKDRYEAKLH